MSNERWHASITPLIISANGDFQRGHSCIQAHRCLAVCKVGPVILTLKHGLDALLSFLLSPHHHPWAMPSTASPVDLIVKVADFPPYLVYSLFVVSSLHLYLEAKPTFTRCDNRLCHSWLHDRLFKPTPANHKC